MRCSLTFRTQSVETTTTRTQQQPRRIYLAAKREKEKKSGKQYDRLTHSSVWAILISEMWSGEYIKKRREEKILHLTLAHLIINRTLALQVPSDWKADMTQTSASLRRQMWRPSVTERQARHQYAVPVHINGKTQLLLVGEDPSQQTLRALKTVCGQIPLHHSRKGDEPSLCY